MVLHLSKEDRQIDIVKSLVQIEVQPEEIKFTTCLQVILNAGWSVSSENYEDILAVSGIDMIRSEYWATYNANRDKILSNNLDDIKNVKFNSRMKKNAKALFAGNRKRGKSYI